MAEQRKGKQRFRAFLVTCGIGVLLYHSMHMLFVEHAMAVQVPWVAAVLLAESLIALLCIIGAVRWLINGEGKYAWFPLRLAAVAVVLHAIRVSIYVLGRTGPNKNFDINPVFREFVPVNWPYIYSSAALAGAALIATLIIWLVIRKRNRPD